MNHLNSKLEQNINTVMSSGNALAQRFQPERLLPERPQRVYVSEPVQEPEFSGGNDEISGALSELLAG